MSDAFRTPWNNWYHCVGNTYGTWLRGDPRGWRSRHHREHVIGDYKHPPPAGKYDNLFEHSKRLMRRSRVELTTEQKRVACLAMAEALLFHGVDLINVAVTRKHFHLLARFLPLEKGALDAKALELGHRISLIRTPRHLVGIAKKRSARALSDAEMLPVGGAWGVRSKCKPIKSRDHQLRVAQYILDHARKERAAVWTLLKD